MAESTHAGEIRRALGTGGSSDVEDCSECILFTTSEATLKLIEKYDRALQPKQPRSPGERGSREGSFRDSEYAPGPTSSSSRSRLKAPAINTWADEEQERPGGGPRGIRLPRRRGGVDPESWPWRRGRSRRFERTIYLDARRGEESARPALSTMPVFEDDFSTMYTSTRVEKSRPAPSASLRYELRAGPAAAAKSQI